MMIFEQSAKGGIAMEQTRYFVNYDERPVIEDFKAKVNVYGEDGGGRVFLAAVAVGDTEDEAKEMAGRIVRMAEGEAWAKRRLAEIDDALEALGRGMDDALDSAKADRGRDMSQAFHEKTEGELKSIRTRNELLVVANLADRLENYRRTVSRMQAEREALRCLVGGGE